MCRRVRPAPRAPRRSRDELRPQLVLAPRAVRSGVREPTPYAERVLATVARIPRGRVMTYGDVAEFMGEGGARAVGGIMRHHGGSVCWHRVVMSDGRPSPSCPDLAISLLVDDDTPMTTDGRRVDLRRARWDGR